MTSFQRGKWAGAILLLLALFTFGAKAETDVSFNVNAVFGTQPPYDTNRVFKIQALSPFQGNFFWRTSDVSGNFWVSNASATVYSGQMLAPPNSLTFSFNVTSTNLGVVQAQSITAIPGNGSQTFPAGQTAWSAQASDLRYQFSSNSASLQFYPLGSNPSNYVNVVVLQSATNSLLQSLTNNLDVNIIQADNVILPFASAMTKANASSNLVAAVPGTDYDAPGAAIAATNGMGIASGVSAFVPTNRFEISGASLAATNAAGVASGLSAYVPTNRFAVSSAVIAATNDLYTTLNAAKANKSTTVAVAGTAFQITSSAGAQSLAANASWTLSFPNTMQTPGTLDVVSNLTAEQGFILPSAATTVTNLLGADTDGNVFPIIVGSGLSYNPGSLTLSSIGSVTTAGITNAYGTNLPTGLVVGQRLYYPTNDPSVASNFLAAEITTTSNRLQTYKADTNSPTIYTPILNGGLLNATTNNGLYLTGGGGSDSLIANAITGINITPGGAGALSTSGAFVAGSSIKANSGVFIGNGSSITNASATNLNLGALGQVTNVVSALAITNAVGTNTATGSVVNNTLFYPTNQVQMSNGFSISQQASNLITLGDIGFGKTGQATNIVSSTNYLYFVGAGSSLTTNGALIWQSSLNCYTNWQNGSILTNNSSAWLYQTNGVTLYSLSGSSPIGAYGAVSGAIPAPTAYYTAALNDHMIQLGYWSVSNQNQLFSNATNGVIAYTTNFVTTSGGFSTNSRLYNTRLISGDGFELDNANVFQGQQIDYQSAAFGRANTNRNGGLGTAILSGATNLIDSDGAGLIAGGIRNSISGGSGNADVIVGGAYNTLNGSAGIGSIDANFIGAGLSNTINSVSTFAFIGGGLNNKMTGAYAEILGGYYNTNLQDGGVILGGSSNLVNGKWSIASGRNVAITKDNVNAWSDGTAITSPTNAQHYVSATNGFKLDGPLWLGSNNTNNGVYYLSNAPFSLYAVTNAMPNFAHWHGNSNGALVDIKMSNGVPSMVIIAP